MLEETKFYSKNTMIKKGHPKLQSSILIGKH